MDYYGIFNVQNVTIHSYACVLYTLRSVDTPTASQHNTFDSENSQSLLGLLAGFEFGSLMLLSLESDALPIEPPGHPG